MTPSRQSQVFYLCILLPLYISLHFLGSIFNIKVIVNSEILRDLNKFFYADLASSASDHLLSNVHI